VTKFVYLNFFLLGCGNLENLSDFLIVGWVSWTVN